MERDKRGANLSVLDVLEMRILIIAMSGMGNVIMFGPTLIELRKSYPEAEITLMVSNAFSAIPFRGSIERVIYCKKSVFEILKTPLNLRRYRYDVSLTIFPSNHIAYNLLAFLIGAKKRVTHCYKVGRLKTMSFLQNQKVEAKPGIHDVDQNLRLLNKLGINKPQEPKLFFCLTKQDRASATNLLKRDGIGEEDKIIGLQFSTNPSMPYKHWDEANCRVFAQLADYLSAVYGTKTLLFGGPEERATTERIKSLMATKAIITPNYDLGLTAALISHCSFFINTDSGLGHVAAAMDIPSLTIFSNSNPSRTKPYGTKSHILHRDLPCLHCLKYPFGSTTPQIKCPNDWGCMGKIDLQKVIKAIDTIWREKI